MNKYTYFYNDKKNIFGLLFFFNMIMEFYFLEVYNRTNIKIHNVEYRTEVI